MLLAGDVMLSGGCSCGLPGVNVQPVLTLFGEAYGESDHIVVGDGVRYVFGQALLLDAVLVQSRHEIRQWPRHAKLYLQFASSEHQSLLKEQLRS